MGVGTLDVTQTTGPARNALLTANYPNPFFASTTVSFSISTVENVTLSVFDLAGREVKRLMENKLCEAGEHQVDFRADDLPSGVYLCRLQAGRTADTRRLVLIRRSRL
jgi:hypothetical protein